MRRLTKPVVTIFGNGADADQYARALAAIVGRSTRTRHALPAGGGTILDLVAVLAAGRATARSTACCGFTSVTYFSHTFRARFGERASDIRRAALPGPS